MTMTARELAIFRTLAYFAHFQFPLTSFEIWKWLMTDDSCTFVDVERALAGERLSRLVARKGGFYSIGDIDVQIPERQRRLADALRKYRKTDRLARIAAFLPWLSGLAVCNSLAYHHTTGRSDIDLFVVTMPGRIWSTRLVSTGPLALLRQRPGEATIDPVCFSFFVTEQSLDLQGVKIDQRDPYLAYWIATLAPIIDRGRVFERVWHANGWVRNMLPHARRTRRAAAFRPRVRKPLPWLPLVERWAERVQRQRFPKHIRSLMNRDTRVVVTDGMLKFHDNDRRAAIGAALAAAVAPYEAVE